ncbi:hypothetical protein [Nocardioides sp. R-C-SC26]|uniref:hypothetical protein n=1 Tax=Nocardioides sp. R-C-SC26 TaxID=2870414 RepID=UPI001E3BE5DB|nr:hypothetical protein [Nocardioides sp. R-C-SC26]
MSTTPVATHAATPPTASAPPRAQLRVRHQARDAAALMAFSLGVSSAVAIGLVALAHLGGR